MCSCIIAFDQIGYVKAIEQLHLNAIDMQCKAAGIHCIVI